MKALKLDCIDKQAKSGYGRERYLQLDVSTVSVVIFIMKWMQADLVRLV